MGAHRDQRLAVHCGELFRRRPDGVVEALRRGHIRAAQRLVNVLAYQKRLVGGNMIFLGVIAGDVGGIGVAVDVSVFPGVPVQDFRLRDLPEIGVVFIRQFVERIGHPGVGDLVQLRLPPAKGDEIGKVVSRDQGVQRHGLAAVRRAEPDIHAGFLRDGVADGVAAPDRIVPADTELQLKSLEKILIARRARSSYETCFVISFLINHKTGSAIR